MSKTFVAPNSIWSLFNRLMRKGADLLRPPRETVQDAIGVDGGVLGNLFLDRQQMLDSRIHPVYLHESSPTVRKKAAFTTGTPSASQRFQTVDA